MTQGQRLNLFISQTFLSYNAFAKKIELAGPATLYMIRDDKRDISPELIGRIKKIYPYLNSEWLLKEEGEMFLSEDKIVVLPQILKEEVVCNSCAQKERYIKMLEERIEEQKKTIETYRKCIEALRSEEDPKKNTALG